MLLPIYNTTLIAGKSSFRTRTDVTHYMWARINQKLWCCPNKLSRLFNLFTPSTTLAITRSALLLQLAHIPFLKPVCYLKLEWTPEKPEFYVWACDLVSFCRYTSYGAERRAHCVILEFKLHSWIRDVQTKSGASKKKKKDRTWYPRH